MFPMKYVYYDKIYFQSLLQARTYLILAQKFYVKQKIIFKIFYEANMRL